MIQRIQTLWLLLAIGAAFTSIKLPFYSGALITNNTYLKFNATDSIPILILTVLSILLSLIAMFSFKNRSRQTWMTVANILVAILILVLYFLKLKDYSAGSFSLTSIIVFALPVFLVMALLGIRKDVKLIKSLDRLR